MPRQPIVAVGFLALALWLGLTAFRSSAIAQEHADPKDQPAVGADSHGPAAGAPAHGEASGGGENPIEPQPSLAIWTVVVFLGLLWVLQRFAWKPLLAALTQREEHLEHVLLETERARNESEMLLAEHRRRMLEAEDQVRALIEEGRKNAQALADEIGKKALAEAESTKHRAERDIATAKDQALAAIWERTADLAVSVAGRVLNKSLTDDDHRRLVDSAIAELPGADGHGGKSA
jgi:F-type H+-transporting ATPase subunit b